MGETKMLTMTYDEGSPLKGPMAARIASDTVLPIVLTASNAQAANLAVGAGKVMLGSTGNTDYWVQFDVGNISIPANTANTANAGPLLNPTLLITQGHSNICVIAASNCTVNLEFYK